MRFRKLLSMVGMLTVIVPTSMTVVACNNIKINQDAITKNKIKNILEAGINGKILNVKNTQQDALNLMQNDSRINGIAVLSLVNANDATKTLKNGNNYLNIKISVNDNSITTDKALITNINPINPDDIVQANDIKTYLEKDGVKGFILKRNFSTQQDALNLMQQDPKIKDIAILSFVNKNDADQPLVGTPAQALNIIITVNTFSIATDKALIRLEKS